MTRTRHLIALSMLAGVAVGAIAVQGLHAQVKPPSYVVVDFEAITNSEAERANSGRSNQAAADVLKPFGGRQLARTEAITPLDGTPPKRFIILAFESREKAEAWYNSPGQKKVNATRLLSTKSRAFIIEGLE
jgi:uncharacterized protein (DUF1330 family)